MQEIRCTKCHKVIAKRSDGVTYTHNPKIGEEYYAVVLGDEQYIEIQCPHNYRDENGKNVQCKTLNQIVI